MVDKIKYLLHKQLWLVIAFIMLILSIAINPIIAQQKVEEFSFYGHNKLGPILMESTFHLYDPSNLNSSGTCFVVARIMNVDSSSKYVDSTYMSSGRKTYDKYKRFQYFEILLTAAHVLKKVEGDSVNIVLRSKDGTSYTTFDYALRIRENGKQLWTQITEDIDIAALIVSLPNNAAYTILTDDHFVSSDIINLNSGDDLLCLGFPYSTPSDEWHFPILRSGKYASYRSDKKVIDKSFLFDFKVYPGNSGGPVFSDMTISMSSKGNTIYTTAKLLGLVSDQLKAVGQKEVIEVAKVMSADYIKKTIEAIYITSDTFKYQKFINRN